MKPVDFAYARPAGVDEALALLARDDLTAKVMAGSQSLGPMLNMRLVQPDLLVDITGIAELRGADVDKDDLVIGACITHSDIEDGRLPDVTGGALPAVASGIAYRAVRNRGTIGGSVAHADPAADWISVLAALGASVTIRGRTGSRSLPVEDFMLGALEADLSPGELLVSVRVPKMRKGSRWGFFKFSRKTGEFAHAIGAFMIDPERRVRRAVVGATDTRPIVAVGDAASVLVGDGRACDAGAADALLAERGMQDPIERQIHVVALKRAVEGAVCL